MRLLSRSLIQLFLLTTTLHAVFCALPSVAQAQALADGENIIDSELRPEFALPALSSFRAAYSGASADAMRADALQEQATQYCTMEGYDQAQHFETTADLREKTIEGFYLAKNRELTPTSIGLRTAYQPGYESLVALDLAGVKIDAMIDRLTSFHTSLAHTAGAPHLVSQQVLSPPPSRWLRPELDLETYRHITIFNGTQHYPRIFSRLICGYHPSTLPLLQRFLGEANSSGSPEGLRLLENYRHLEPAKRKEFLQFFSQLSPPQQASMRRQTTTFWRLFTIAPNFFQHLKALTTTQSFAHNLKQLALYYFQRGAKMLKMPDLFLADSVFATPYTLPANFQWGETMSEMEAQMLLHAASQAHDLEALGHLKSAYRAKNISASAPGSGLARLSRLQLSTLASYSQKMAAQELIKRLGQVATTDRAASTPPSPQQDSSTCSICLDAPGIAQGPSHCRCLNYCAGCAREQFQQASRRTGVVATCPAPSCRQPIQPSFFASTQVISPQELLRFERQQLAATAQERLPQWQPCPNSECVYGTQRPQKLFDQHFACPACDHHACLKCNQLHLNRSCAGELEPGVESLLAKGRRIRIEPRPHPLAPNFEDGMNRPCPHCGKIAGRDDGCNTVQCSSCLKNFHWNFGKKGHHHHDYHNLPQAYRLEPGVHPHF